MNNLISVLGLGWSEIETEALINVRIDCRGMTE